VGAAEVSLVACFIGRCAVKGWFGKRVCSACGAVPHASIGQPLEITNGFHLDEAFLQRNSTCL
jgi:hypothetical protein